MDSILIIDVVEIRLDVETSTSWLRSNPAFDANTTGYWPFIASQWQSLRPRHLHTTCLGTIQADPSRQVHQAPL